MSGTDIGSSTNPGPATTSTTNTQAVYAVPGSGVGPSIAASGATLLASGDVLEGNAATTGTPGSGSAVVGFLQLDSNGNAVGILVPRTNTLASLLALSSEPAGEIASATDVPATVQYTTGGETATPTYPFNSAQDYTNSGTGAVTDTALPCSSDVIRLTIGSSVTSYTGTFSTAFTPIDGQQCTIEVISTPSGLTSIVLNGVTVASSTANATRFSSANIAGPNSAGAFLAIFKYDAGSVNAWKLVKLDTILPSSVAAAAANSTNINPGSSATTVGTGVNAVSISGARIPAYGGFGIGTFSGSVYGAFGNSLGGTVYGLQGTVFPIGATVPQSGGRNAAAFGGNSYGDYSITELGGYTGYATAAAFGISWSTPTSITGPSPFVAALTATTQFEVGSIINVQSGGVTGLSQPGTVTAVTPGTSITFTLNTTTGTAIDPTVAGTRLIPTSWGQKSKATGAGAYQPQQGSIAEAPADFASSPGSGQRGRYLLGCSTTDGSTAVNATLTYGAANTNITPGLANRILLENNKSYAVTLKMTAKQGGATGGVNVAMWQRTFMMVNQAGTCSLSTVSTLGTDAVIGTATGGPVSGASWITWAGTNPFTIGFDGTVTNALDIAFTGPAASTNVRYIVDVQTDEVVYA